MNSIEINKKRITEAFNGLNINSIDSLDQFYDSDAEFTDPVSQHRGLAQIKNYYRHVYKNVKSIHFEFDRIEHAGNMYYAHWTMTMQVRGLNYLKPYSVEGISSIRFNEKNLVVEHRDYLDLGSMVYEKIPVLGGVITKIKNMMRA